MRSETGVFSLAPAVLAICELSGIQIEKKQRLG